MTEVDAVTIGIYWECPEDPLSLAGQPLGQYHCPWCGCMQIAGVEHLPHEISCWLGLWDPEGEDFWYEPWEFEVDFDS